MNRKPNLNLTINEKEDVTYSKMRRLNRYKHFYSGQMWQKMSTKICWESFMKNLIILNEIILAKHVILLNVRSPGKFSIINLKLRLYSLNKYLTFFQLNYDFQLAHRTYLGSARKMIFLFKCKIL
jgi:hypothetical protein